MSLILVARPSVTPLALSVALSFLTATAWAAPEIVANDNGRQQSGVFGSAWLYDAAGTPSTLPIASGGTSVFLDFVWTGSDSCTHDYIADAVSGVGSLCSACIMR